MWRCTNCSHLDVGEFKPQRCPICGAEADKFVVHDAPGVKGESTLQHLKEGSIAESRASIRNSAFAMQADREELPQIASLFRAIAASEEVHAFNHLRLLGAIFDTQTNLQSAFERENVALDAYPQFIREAEEEGNEEIARLFGFVRDVEGEHAGLYRKALDHMTSDRETEYYVCGVCGHIEDGAAPESCPICGAPQDQFRKIT